MTKIYLNTEIGICPCGLNTVEECNIFEVLCDDALELLDIDNHEQFQIFYNAIYQVMQISKSEFRGWLIAHSIMDDLEGLTSKEDGHEIHYSINDGYFCNNCKNIVDWNLDCNQQQQLLASYYELGLDTLYSVYEVSIILDKYFSCCVMVEDYELFPSLIAEMGMLSKSVVQLV